jgi:kumamolisin
VKGLAVGGLLVTAGVLAASASGAWGLRLGVESIDGNVAPGISRLAPIRLHRDSAVLRLNVGLAVRSSARLDDVIRAASTPGYGGSYLTQAQYRAEYAPTDATVAKARSWLSAQGLSITGVAPANLWVEARGTTAAIEHAFGVTIGDYRSNGRVFFANDRAPTVPTSLRIDWVSGLDDYALPRTTIVERPRRAGASLATCGNTDTGYCPSDYRAAYGVPAAWNGDEQTIGMQLSTAGPTTTALEQDLSTFASRTKTPAMTVGTNPGQVELVRGDALPDSNHAFDDELELDIEAAHGAAPGAHIKYFVSRNTNAAIESSLAALAADPTVHVASLSWGWDTLFDQNIENALQMGAAAGTTFYVSSGDDQILSYPSSSRYVVGVGGTRLGLDSSGAYQSEAVWSKSASAGRNTGSGAGCNQSVARPVWQYGADVTARATCSGRATPDIALVGDPSTGMYFRIGDADHKFGGTSMSAPLMAGFTADWNAARIAGHLPTVGFVAPLLYALGNDPSTYGNDFRDVKTGAVATAIPAAAGWDEASGWGSPNFANLQKMSASVRGDWNGDGKVDPAVYAPVVSIFSNTATMTSGKYFGLNGDIPVPADYDGDLRTDLAVYRDGRFFINGREPLTLACTAGVSTPVPADYNGDGAADPAVFCPATGKWLSALVNLVPPGGFAVNQAIAGDIPVPADYNGDGRAEIAWYRPSTTGWGIGNKVPIPFGDAGAIPVPADYDGDGSTDIAYYLNGAWHFQKTNSTVTFGAPGAVPVPGDYDGDGKADPAYYTPSTVRCRADTTTRPPRPVCTTLAPATWHIRYSRTSTTGSVSFGSNPIGMPLPRPLPLPYAIYSRFFFR